MNKYQNFLALIAIPANHQKLVSSGAFKNSTLEAYIGSGRVARPVSRMLASSILGVGIHRYV